MMQDSKDSTLAELAFSEPASKTGQPWPNTMPLAAGQLPLNTDSIPTTTIVLQLLLGNK
jgi:hypothetical protein